MSTDETDEPGAQAREGAAEAGPTATASEGSGAREETPASANGEEKSKDPTKKKRAPRDARTYPRPPVGDPLYEAWAALDRGDHAGARARATALLAHEDEGVREGARDLIERLEPDRVVLAVFALTLLLMVGLALAYIAGSHAAHAH